MPDQVTSQIPRANLALLIHATEEPSVHRRTTAEMPVAHLEDLLVEERRTTPMAAVQPVEAAMVPVDSVHSRAIEVLLRVPVLISLGLLGGIGIGLACLWA
jgi:hypothetical protein